MFPSLKVCLFTILLGALLRADAQINAASCNASDVQTAINTATEGQTVTVPAGTCTWTSGVTITGKGITVTGAGSGRIIAYSSSTLTIGTGSKTLTISSSRVDGTFPLGPSIGQTLTLYETGLPTNFMTGTVTSFSGGSLVMNITSDGGSCGATSLSNCARWLIATQPSTTIINNYASDPGLINITEDTSFNTNISGIQIVTGTGGAHMVNVNYASGGVPVLLHDCWMRYNNSNTAPPSGNQTPVFWQPNRGVIWNCSFDGTPGPNGLFTSGGISLQDKASGQQNSWTTISKMGSLDTTGTRKLYVETNDFHALTFAMSTDDNGRLAARYNLIDNSQAFGTHGADSSDYGQRYFEFYNNTLSFNGYRDGTTFNLANGWFWLRGGTAVIYNNTIPALSSTDYGNKPDLAMTVFNLQDNTGPNPCWGSGSSHTEGEYQQAPRQVGFGYVTGTGTANYPFSPENCKNCTNDSITYVGDSEPLYVWGNSRQPLGNVSITDGGGSCTNPDSSANYIVSGRDYFNGSTAKPGYSVYQYPHPLTQGTAPAPPTGLSASVQ